jgi:hypothetical protein
LQIVLWFLGAGALVAVMMTLGLAAAAIIHRQSMSPGEDLMVALAGGIAVPALATAIQLPFSFRFIDVSPPLMLVLLALSAVILWRRRTWLAGLARDEQVRLVAVAIGGLVVLGLAVGALPWDRPADLNAGTVASTHVLNMPGDSVLQYRTAQILQNRLDIATTNYYVNYWYLSDRTPLVGLVTTFVESAARISLPTATLDSLNAPFQPVDPYGYWLYRLISIFTNGMVVASATIAAWALLGSRAAKLGIILTLLSPYVFINIMFHWPKLLVGFFIVGYWFWSYVRIRPVLAGTFASAAVLSHPIGALFVPGMLLLIAFKRQWAQLFITAAAGLVVALPWFFWAGVIYHHMSRMATYPIGYALNNPTNPWPEIKSDLRAFVNRGPASIAYDRWVCVRDTFTTWPIPQQLITATRLRALGTPVYEIFRTSFPGMFGAGLAAFGYATWRRVVTEPFWAATLGASTVCAFLFWGFTPRALAQEMFQPGVGLWIGLACALLLALPRWVARAVVVVSAVEWIPFTYVLLLKTPGPGSWHLGGLMLVLLSLVVVGAIGVVGWNMAAERPGAPPVVEQKKEMVPPSEPTPVPA